MNALTLPNVLPIGTVISYRGGEATLLEPSERRANGLYACVRRRETKAGVLPADLRTGVSLNVADDGSNVRLPAAAPESEACAGCGLRGQRLAHLNGNASWIEGLAGIGLCSSCLPNVEDVCAGIRARRAKLSTADEGPESAPLHVGADNGATAQLCSTPACATRGVEATDAGLCVYCSSRDRLDDYESMMGMIQRRQDEAARARLAAWELAGKPRMASAAERKSLAAGHPSTWPSNEGED